MRDRANHPAPGASRTTFWLAAAMAAAVQPGRSSAQEVDSAGADPEIVVTGSRGSVVADVAPLAVLDANAVAASGATNMAEFLRSVRAVTQSADGLEPIFLMNGQRVSGYQEIGTLPPEAIERVEVLPEVEALRFGYPPTRRVVNFITKPRFEQVELRATAGTTTRAGSIVGNANAVLTRLHDKRRLTLALERRHTGSLHQSERDIAPDPDVLFDAIGNVTAAGGGEIDPALSAAAGELVTVAPVPQASDSRSTLSAYAAGANRPRLFDIGPYRTLVPRNDAYKAEAVLADRIGSTLAGSLSLSAEQSRDHTEAGPAAVTLTVPVSSPYSPFDRPVLLHRYLTEADPLRQRQTTTTLHAGGAVRGAIAGWQWDLSAALDQQQTNGRSERGIDVTAADAAIAAGANPFAPLDEALVSARLVDRARLLTRTALLKTVATGAPVRLPAGPATLTATAEAERATATSSTRGPDPFSLRYGRTRAEGAIALDLPLASTRERVLPFLGELSANASANVRQVGGFGTLRDTTYGLNWAPFAGVQLLALVKRSAAAPALQQLANPVVHLTNVPVFEFADGRTVLVDATLGGNPDLAAERRRTRSLTANVKPFAKTELRISATYESVDIRDQTGTVYATTPQTEAILPDLFVRDAAGKLVSVTFQPINFHRERQRTLSFTLNANGQVGKSPPAPPPPPSDASGPPPSPPPPRAFYYGGIGPSFKLSDRLRLRPDTRELDLLDGETVTGGNTSRVFGYAYGGINYEGVGLTFDAWYGGGSRVRSDYTVTELRFSSIFKLNVGGYLGLHRFFPKQPWTRKFDLKIDVMNVTDARQRVRDGSGLVPNRFQPDYLDPVGRIVNLTLRKLF